MNILSCGPHCGLQPLVCGTLRRMHRLTVHRWTKSQDVRSAGLSISKENWKAITAKRMWSSLANNGAKAWWSIVASRDSDTKPNPGGCSSPGKFREKPKGGGERGGGERGGGKKSWCSGNLTQLNIMFIYSYTEEQNMDSVCRCVCVCVSGGQVNMPLHVTNLCFSAPFLTHWSTLGNK